MNLLKGITAGDTILEKVSPKYVVYIWLLQQCSAYDDGFIYSDYEVDLLEKKITFVKKGTLRELLKELQEEGLILLTKEDGSEYVQVGSETPDGYAELHKPVDETIIKYTQAVEEAITSYIKTAGGVSIARARGLRNDFVELSGKELQQWQLKDFSLLWQYVYHAVFQEEGRGLMQKEWGQLKSLYGSYDATTLYKLIIYFITGSTKYTKSIPTLGLLCSIRDTVFHDMKGKRKAKDVKAHMRTEKDSEF